MWELGADIPADPHEEDRERRDKPVAGAPAGEAFDKSGEVEHGELFTSHLDPALGWVIRRYLNLRWQRSSSQWPTVRENE